jgi:hypothetical protein
MDVNPDISSHAVDSVTLFSSCTPRHHEQRVGHLVSKMMVASIRSKSLDIRDSLGRITEKSSEEGATS